MKYWAIETRYITISEREANLITDHFSYEIAVNKKCVTYMGIVQTGKHFISLKIAPIFTLDVILRKSFYDRYTFI